MSFILLTSCTTNVINKTIEDKKTPTPIISSSPNTPIKIDEKTTNEVKKIEDNTKVEVNNNITDNEIKAFKTDEEKAFYYKDKGKFDDAEKVCFEVLKNNPNNSDCNYILGDINKNKVNYKIALNYFEKTTNYDAYIKRTEIAGVLNDKPYYDNITREIYNKTDIKTSNIIKGINKYYSTNNFDEIRSLFNEVLKIDEKEPFSLYYLAQVEFDNSNLDKAKEYLEKCIKFNPSFWKAQSLLGFITFDKDNVEKSINYNKKALEINPYDVLARTCFGSGMNNTTYEEIENKNSNLKPEKIFFETGEKAIKLYRNGALNQAINELELLKTKYPNNIHSYIQEGAFYYTIENYDKAVESYVKALKIDNLYGLANFGLAESLLMKTRMQKVRIKKLNFNTLDTSKINLEEVKKIFVNYDNLATEHQKVVLFSVAPFSKYLAKISNQKAKFYISPMYERITDSIYGNYLKNQRTFDGRLWDDTRGFSGENTGIGVEALVGAIYLNKNTLAHEFGHLLHNNLTQEEKTKITSLYNSAKTKNQFLDYYAATNELEYFAQGIEAYVSTQEKVTSKATGKNTQELLKKVDVELFNFIDGLSKISF
ncbi:MAG: tetratricopeptide repeat protein [Candidatus Sericytochromatia bacterium]